MNIIAVDDERHALEALEQAVHQVAPNASLACFQSAENALRYAQGTDVDVAFLDIELVGIGGLFLAKQLKDIRPQANIVFVTGYGSYAINAYEMHVSGYVLKPISPERVAYELHNLRSPVAPIVHGVRVQCFGNFEVFVNEQPVAFGRPKAKEALAYLIDRKGAGVTKKELAAVLWGDEPYTHSIQSHTYVLIREMIRTLARAGAGDIVVRKSGLYYVDASRITCDYYRFVQGDPEAVNSYRGEYMQNYSWAEFTAGALSGDVENKLQH